VDPHPWALVIGLFRPQLVLSTGLLALLDAEELDAVLAHELIHLRRGDVRWTILAGTLQDLGWFLPPARRLYRLLRVEQELACDDALCEEPRRLALASALTRVWQAGVSGAPAPRNALTLLPAGSAGHVEGRVHRLLAAPARPAAVHRWAGTLALGAVVGLVLLLQAGATLWTMTVVGCDLHQMGLVAALMP
jgi:beta-lactamase regulating signal transducer with metallopeptidase domain